MIIAALIWLISQFSGESLKPFSLPLDQAAALVKTHVTDTARCKAALAILKDMEKVDQEWSAARQPKATTMKQLADDRATTPEAFQRFIVETRQQADQVQARFLDLRFQLKAHLTRAEWQAIFPPPRSTVPSVSH